MSTARWGKKWADVEEDDCPLPIAGGHVEAHATQFETEPDKDGIRSIIQYTEKNGVSYKVTTKVRAHLVKKRINVKVVEREKLSFGFGKMVNNADEDGMPVTKDPIKADEEVSLELNQALKIKSVGQDEKFWEESIGVSEKLTSMAHKKKWDANAVRKDAEGMPDIKAPVEPSLLPSMGGGEGRYVPPSLRGKTRAEMEQLKEEATLRVTNLSEDVRDGDLQSLFQPFGRLQRVFLAKHREGIKEGLSKGFAFVTFHERADAEMAMKKLNGHGYDNLILQVNWAKPRE